MGINLSKGGRIDFSKEAPSLKKIGVGLGWDTNESDTGADFDLDASVFMLDNTGKTPQESYFIYYNNLISPDKSVEHTGDNLTGEGDGDDETINIEINKIDSSIEEIVFIVNIYEAMERKQNFGQVSNAFIRLYNIETNEEIAKYDLEEDFSSETAVEVGRLYKKSDSWRFKAVGNGLNEGFHGFLNKFTG